MRKRSIQCYVLNIESWIKSLNRSNLGLLPWTSKNMQFIDSVSIWFLIFYTFYILEHHLGAVAKQMLQHQYLNIIYNFCGGRCPHRTDFLLKMRILLQPFLLQFEVPESGAFCYLLCNWLSHRWKCTSCIKNKCFDKCDFSFGIIYRLSKCIIFADTCFGYLTVSIEKNTIYIICTKKKEWKGEGKRILSFGSVSAKAEMEGKTGT